jgi:hypothetical protein
MVGISSLTIGFSRRTLLHVDSTLQLNISWFVMNIFKVIYKCSLLLTLRTNYVEHTTVSITRNFSIWYTEQVSVMITLCTCIREISRSSWLRHRLS